MERKAEKKLSRNERRVFELTIWNACNGNCTFCSNDPNLRHNYSKQEVAERTQEVIKQMYDAKKDGFTFLGLGGGEPTIYPHIFKILFLAKKLNFKTIRFQTNGIVLSDFNYFKRLVEHGAGFFRFSIHGHKASIHDELSRVKGSFTKVMEALDNAEELGVAIEVNIVLNKLNYKFLPQFVALMLKRGITNIFVHFPIYTGEMYSNRKKYGVNLKEVQSYIIEAINLSNDFKAGRVLTIHYPVCFLVGYEENTTDLSVSLAKIATPSAVIDSLDYQMCIQKIKSLKCKKCKFYDKCFGVWKPYDKIYGLDELEPIIN